MHIYRTEFEGIPLGDPGDPVDPVVEAFATRGVKISRAEVSRLKIAAEESKWGNHMKDRLDCAALLSAGVTPLKDSLYYQVSKTITELRRPQPQYPGRFSSRGLTKDASQILDELNLIESSTKTSTNTNHGNQVRTALRIMRIDLITSELNGHITDPVFDLFDESTQAYFKAYLGPYDSAASLSVKKTKNHWDGRTIADFYANLDAPTSWVSYEQPLMKTFYSQRLEAGSPISSFDSAALMSYAMGEGQIGFSKKVMEKTKIDFNEDSAGIARRVLLHGKL